MSERLGKRAEEITKGPVNEARRHFEEICDLYGHDAEVRKIPDSNTEIAIFFYNDSGNLAETISPYEIFLNQYSIASDTYDKYTFSVEKWHDQIPYLKVTVLE